MRHRQSAVPSPWIRMGLPSIIRFITCQLPFMHAHLPAQNAHQTCGLDGQQRIAWSYYLTGDDVSARRLAGTTRRIWRLGCPSGLGGRAGRHAVARHPIAPCPYQRILDKPHRLPPCNRTRQSTAIQATRLMGVVPVECLFENENDRR